jgi:hypothetical protein
MTSLALALVGLAAVYALHAAARDLLSLRRERLAFDRARYEARKPVPPHDALVAEVAALRSQVETIRAWAKVE